MGCLHGHLSLLRFAIEEKKCKPSDWIKMTVETNDQFIHTPRPPLLLACKTGQVCNRACVFCLCDRWRLFVFVSDCYFSDSVTAISFAFLFVNRC